MFSETLCMFKGKFCLMKRKGWIGSCYYWSSTSHRQKLQDHSYGSYSLKKTQLDTTRFIQSKIHLKWTSSKFRKSILSCCKNKTRLLVNLITGHCQQCSLSWCCWEDGNANSHRWVCTNLETRVLMFWIRLRWILWKSTTFEVN